MSPARDRPLVSIITPSLNRADFIAEAVESVLSQDFQQIEHIVVDGGSQDGTVEILRKYPTVRWRSEPDNGIYDAINRGIEISRGYIIGVLNSDDMYEPNVIADVVRTFDQDSSAAAVMGGASVFRTLSPETIQVEATYSPIPSDELIAWLTSVGGFFNAWFFRRSLFDSLGQMDAKFRFAGDREFLLRLALANTSYRCLEIPVYLYRRHPGSYTLSGDVEWIAAAGEEDLRIAERLLSRADLITSSRLAIRSWHSLRSAELTISSLGRLALERSLRYVFLGLRRDIRWPWVFFQSLVARLTIGRPQDLP